MPRQTRLDTPGTLHHVTVRGIERTVIFRDGPDRADFVRRLAALAAGKTMKASQPTYVVYLAWRRRTRIHSHNLVPFF
jgi:hypothetical protein